MRGPTTKTLLARRVFTTGSLRALRHRNYRRFAAAGCVSVTGTWMQVVAQNWLVLRLSGQATAVGVVVALQAFPSVVLGLFAGSLADRLAKRTLLVVTQLVLAVLAFSLGLATTTGHVSVGLVYVLALGLGIVLAVDSPANTAFGAELVPDDDLPNAIALGSVANSVGRIGGMSLAGALVGLVGTGFVFLANGCSYLAVVVTLLALNTSELRPVARAARADASVRAGLRVALRSRVIVVTVVVAFFVAAFGRNYQVTMAVMSRSVFGSGARGYGVLSVVFAAGALGGGLLAARLVRPTLRIVVGAAAIAGVLELAGAVAPTLFAFAMCIAPIAVIAVLFDTTVLAIVQGAAIDTHRARVIALLSTVSMLGATAGGPMLGWFADALNGRAALALGGTVVLVAAGGVGLVAQRTAERRAGVRTTVAMSFSGR